MLSDSAFILNAISICVNYKWRILDILFLPYACVFLSNISKAHLFMVVKILNM